MISKSNNKQNFNNIKPISIDLINKRRANKTQVGITTQTNSITQTTRVLMMLKVLILAIFPLDRKSLSLTSLIS